MRHTRTTLRFGELRTVNHTIGANDIPGSIYQEIVNRYAAMKARAHEQVPNLPIPGMNINPIDLLPDLTEGSLRTILTYLAPTIQASYLVSTGSCADLNAVTITNPDNQLVGPTSVGFSLWDVEVSLKPTFTIIGGAEKLINCIPADDRLEAFILAFNAWRETGEEGVRPKPSDFGLNRLEELEEEVENGKKTRTFQIKWFLDIRIARFDYRVPLVEQVHSVSTFCCER